jgi:hypothetical protein
VSLIGGRGYSGDAGLSMVSLAMALYEDEYMAVYSWSEARSMLSIGEDERRRR